MKKIIALVLVLFSIFSVTAFAASNYVILFGKDIIVLDSDQPQPYLEEKTLMIPVEYFCQELSIGFKLDEDTVILTKPDKRIVKVATDELVLKDNVKYMGLSEYSQKLGLVASYNKKLISMSWREPVESFKKTLKVGNRNIAVSGVEVNLKDDGYLVDLALANNSVGMAQSMREIVEETEASIAINGSYFDAYSGTPDPYGLLIKDGKLVHNGADRGVIGFSDDNILFDRVNSKVHGHNDLTYKWKHQWIGTWFNHSVLTNGPSINVYTQDRGEETRSEEGINYIVKDGVITDKVIDQSVKIPEDGMVINLYGDLHPEILSAFEVGRPSYIDFSYIIDNEVSEEWNDVNVAVGAGPLLVKDGEKDIDFKSEHFYEAKIVSSRASRSAIGRKTDGTLVMVVTVATMDELAEIMLELGCEEALNLDGGASSGLYVNGEWLREPSRDLSNVIIFK